MSDAHPGRSTYQPSVPFLSGRRFVALVVALGGVSALLTVLLFVLPPDSFSRDIVSGMFQLGSMLFALCCLLWAVRRSPPGRVHWAWLCITGAILAYVIALVILTVVDVDAPPGVKVPRPLIVDILFLLFYPLLIVGIALIPAARERSTQRLRVFLDSGIIVLTLFSLSLVIVILPRVAQFARANIGPAETIFPFADFALVLILIALFGRSVHPAYRPVFLWLAGGMICFVYADTALNVVTLRDPTYSAGSPWIDPFWVISAFAIGLAALFFVVHGETALPNTRWMRLSSGTPVLLSPTSWSYLLLYGSVLISFGVIAVQLLSNNAATPFALPILLIVTFCEILLVITRQVLLAQDLAHARLEISQAQEVDAVKDLFITSVNHELRTPMMTMQGYIELLGERDGRLAPQQRQAMIERARRANSALVRLLEGILDTRRIEQEARDVPLEAVNVQAVIYEAIAIIDPREATTTERELSLHIDPQLEVWAEPVRLAQVLSNLLSNAVKYSPAGTPIIVSAQRIAVLRKGNGSGAKKSKADMIEITVQDFGLGVPPGQIPLLFRRFVRLPRDIASKVRGTGLGLYLCRAFVEAMGGTIWVESTGVAGEGSTFHVRLSAPPEVAPAQPALQQGVTNA